MTKEPTVKEISNRFFNEQNYVQRYVAFLQPKVALHDSEVRELSNVLRRNGLRTIPTGKEWFRDGQAYSPTEIGKLLASMQQLNPALDQAITEAQNKLERVGEPKDLQTVDARSEIGEWIEYMIDALGPDPSPEAIGFARQEAMEHQERIRAEIGEDAELIDQEAIDYAIQSALYISAIRRLDDLLYVRDRFAEIELAARITGPDTEINIHRQGFILLMTVFDAAVFDLVRVALRRDFFRLIGTFGRQERIALQRFGNFPDFEGFRDYLIEEQLKSRYLKDVLFLLRDLGVQCVDETSNDRFVHLIELVLRRNVHIHNRGIVDDRYLERDQRGQPHFNIYNLALGEVAHVDETYWQLANRLCRTCIINVACWAEADATRRI